MAGWTVLVYALFTALLLPMLTAFLNWGIFRGDRMIVGNDELYTWFFSPAGSIYLFVAILIVLIGLVIRFSGLFQIVTDFHANETVSVKNTFLHIVPRFHVIVKLCAITIAGFILLLLPLLLGLGIIYWSLLTEFDINYYILSTPPEWYIAVRWSIFWGSLWGLFALFLIACSLPALPAYLSGDKSILGSIKEVWNAPLFKTLKLIKTMTLVVAVWFLIRLIFEGLLLASFLALSEWVQLSFESLRLIVLTTGTYLFLSITIGSIISFFGFSMISTVIINFYYDHARPGINIQVPDFLRLTRKTFGLFIWWTKPIRATALILTVFLGGLGVSYFISQDEADNQTVLNIAHRANALGAPENSIAALENSIALGADMVEIDVQLTSDGEVIVIHDVDFIRVTGNPARVRETTYSEISDLLLITDQEIPDQKRRVPTLAEFIDAADNDIKFLIELKYYGFYPELAERAVEVVREKNIEDRTLFMSLSMDALRQMNQIAPEFAMGYTSAAAAGNLHRLPANFLAAFHQNLSVQLVSEFSSQGRPVFAWTVNNAQDMISAIEVGATGLITDRPDLANTVIEEMKSLTRAERLLLNVGLLVIDPPVYDKITE